MKGTGDTKGSDFQSHQCQRTPHRTGTGEKPERIYQTFRLQGSQSLQNHERRTVCPPDARSFLEFQFQHIPHLDPAGERPRIQSVQQKRVILRFGSLFSHISLVFRPAGRTRPFSGTTHPADPGKTAAGQP